MAGPGHTLIRDDATGEIRTSDGTRIFDVPDPSGEPDGRWLRTSGGAAVWEPASGVVTSLDGIAGDVSLVSGANVTITPNSPSAGDITIAATGGGGGALPGNSSLVYRYTVTGSDKPSIDTGLDTPDAGSNDWTNGDVLEILLVSRTDDTAATANLFAAFNNDTGNNYDRQLLGANNASLDIFALQAETALVLNTHGSGGSSDYPAVSRLTVPGFAGTTFYKVVEQTMSAPDATGANQFADVRGFGWRSAAAITRFAVKPQTAGKKLKVGTQLLIYKRLAS